MDGADGKYLQSSEWGNSMNKLDTLIDIEGFTDIDEMMHEVLNSSVNPGICMNKNCNYTTIVEPDCATGYCEMCDTNTVKSATELILF